MAGLSEVRKEAGVTEDQARAVLDAIRTITRRGEEVRIRDFGTFSKKHKDAYTGRNPATGEDVEVAAKDVLHFKATKGMDMSAPKAAGGRRR